MDYEFNNDQKDIMNTKLKYIKDDLQRLSSDMKTDVFNVSCGHLPSVFSELKSHSYKYIICIDKSSEKFECKLIVHSYSYNEYKTLELDLNCHYCTDFDLYSFTTLIQNYPLVRKKVMKKIRQMKNYEDKEEEKKKDNDHIIDSILSDEIPKSGIGMDASKEVNIEFQYPDTMNMHELELKEENGRRVGLIDFGDMCVKILTNGDISLVQDEKQSKSAETKERVKLFKKFSSK